MLRPLILLLLALALPACSVLTGVKETRLLYPDHPLNDRIWDVQAQRFVSRAELQAAIDRSRQLLLGEIHDNPLHHQHQAEMIDALGKRSAVVLFEMIDDTQAQRMAERKPQSVDALIDTLDQVKNGWHYDPLYLPVLRSALAGGHPILPASLARDTILGIMRKDEEAVPAAIRRVMDHSPLDGAQQASLEKEIELSHCGMLHGGMATGMIRAQRAKDAAMAARMIAQDKVDVRVLVAGAGHTRTDRGVPYYLQGEGAAGPVLSLAWMEVQPDRTTVDAYAAQWENARLPFDYVWFTPRVEREAPCAAMRAHFRKDK